MVREGPSEESALAESWRVGGGVRGVEAEGSACGQAPRGGEGQSGGRVAWVN